MGKRCLGLNTLSGAALTINPSNAGLLATFVAAMVLLVGVLAGLYPAFALTRFQPIMVLKGAFKSGKQGRSLRVGLVVFQFALSIALIGSTAIVQKQLDYIQTKDLGYDREQVVLFDMVDQTMGQSLETYREALSGHSAFVNVASSGNVPGRTFGRTRVRPGRRLGRRHLDLECALGEPGDVAYAWDGDRSGPQLQPRARHRLYRRGAYQ